MSAEFADTNVVLYLLDDGPKAERAEEILGRGPWISVQVLNEAMVIAGEKLGSVGRKLERFSRASSLCLRSRT
jgi:predicted nucleic acid-binding protein